MKLVKINEEHYVVVDDSGKYILDTKQNLSLQEVKELISEVDVEKKAQNIHYESQSQGLNADGCFNQYQGYIKGYNQALEDNKEKKYTQQELIWAIQEAYGHGQDDEFDGMFHLAESIEVITKSLQPKTELEVEIVDGKLKLV